MLPKINNIAFVRNIIGYHICTAIINIILFNFAFFIQSIKFRVKRDKDIMLIGNYVTHFV